MNGYNFTERVRRVLAMAREESARLYHEYVGTEHILLALVRHDDGIANAVLQNLSVDVRALQEEIEQTVSPGRPSRATGPDLPYTSRAKKVLELAMSEARDLNHSYVGTEHLLLGLIREDKGIAAQVLIHNGVTAERAREEVVRLLGPVMPNGAPPTPPPRRGDADSPMASMRQAQLELMQGQAAAAAEERMWSRLRRALELCESLGTVPRLTRRPDGAVEVRVTEELAVVIPQLPGLELRRAPPAPDE